MKNSQNFLASDFEGESQENCSEYHHQMIEMRQAIRSLQPIQPHAPTDNPTPFEEEIADNFSSREWGIEKGKEPLTTIVQPVLSSRRVQIGNPMPVYGSISIKGHSLAMNDQWFVKEDFCRSDIFCGQPLHFFAVYDGHRSALVSSLCRDLLHIIAAEEFTSVLSMGSIRRGTTEDGSNAVDGNNSRLSQETHQCGSHENVWEDHIQQVMKNSFKRVDQAALYSCMSDGVLNICKSWSKVFNTTGSTANVAILTPSHIIVANCGNSRAVLCRAGNAIPLSHDHKPNRQDELERIYNAGGKLVYRNSLPFVNGILKMSRAIGDYSLKEVIISEPEVSLIERDTTDVCLILASDGMWDVISSGLACKIASECLRDGSPATATECPSQESSIMDEAEEMFPTKSALASSILCRLALGRGSLDNITVIVVDLREGNEKQ
ncbi:hypothetical protein SLA2020_111940 [Shorea laevis]